MYVDKYYLESKLRAHTKFFLLSLIYNIIEHQSKQKN